MANEKSKDVAQTPRITAFEYDDGSLQLGITFRGVPNAAAASVLLAQLHALLQTDAELEVVTKPDTLVEAASHAVEKPTAKKPAARRTAKKPAAAAKASDPEPAPSVDQQEEPVAAPVATPEAAAVATAIADEPVTEVAVPAKGEAPTAEAGEATDGPAAEIPAELIRATSFRQVVTYLISAGVKTEAGVLEACELYKKAPVFGRLSGDMSGRVKRALEALLPGA